MKYIQLAEALWCLSCDAPIAPATYVVLIGTSMLMCVHPESPQYVPCPHIYLVLLPNSKTKKRRRRTKISMNITFSRKLE